MPDFSRQAKAVAAFVVTLLVQIQVYVGQGGTDALLSVTLGQWISIAILTFAAYGVVYSVPNVTAVQAAGLPTPVVTVASPVDVVALQSAHDALHNDPPAAGEGQ